MQKKVKYPHLSLFRFNLYKRITLLVITVLLSACGSSYPTLTHFKAIDKNFSTVIDTKDTGQLAALSELFYDRRESNDVTADLDFIYLFDATTEAGSERWRCTINGYCQLRTEGAVPQREIYYMERYKELYARSNLD